MGSENYTILRDGKDELWMILINDAVFKQGLKKKEISQFVE